MKRTEIIKKLRKIAKAQGEELVMVEGGSHTKVFIGGKQTVVARHTEINENTARSIIRHFEKEEAE